MQESDANTTQQVAGALVYWRKGPRYVPTIMTLDSNGILSLTAADQTQLLHEPLSQVSIRFSAWGTLHLEAKGVAYAIRSSGGLAAPSIPRWQADAARQIGQAGIFTSTMRGWQDVFIHAGAPLKRRQMRAMTLYVVTLVIIVVGAALLAKHR